MVIWVYDLCYMTILKAIDVSISHFAMFSQRLGNYYMNWSVLFIRLKSINRKLCVQLYILFCDILASLLMSIWCRKYPFWCRNFPLLRQGKFLHHLWKNIELEELIDISSQENPRIAGHCPSVRRYVIWLGKMSKTTPCLSRLALVWVLRRVKKFILSVFSQVWKNRRLNI